MEKRFVVPATTMLAGLAVWIVFLVVDAVGDGSAGQSSGGGGGSWLPAALCVAAAALIVFSAYRCRAVGGPRIGSLVRTLFLVGMAAVTWWLVGGAMAAVLVLGALATGAMYLAGTVEAETMSDTPGIDRGADLA